MSRRRGQNGHIVVSGKWYRVRFWIDVAGQETRVHLSEKICPVSGPELLSQSERMRRARGIIAASGADSAELFNRVVKHVDAVTFRKQASDWQNEPKQGNATQLRPPQSKHGKAVSPTGSTPA